MLTTLAAASVIENDPAVVGVPVMSAPLIARPAGNGVAANVMGSVPDAAI